MQQSPKEWTEFRGESINIGNVAEKSSSRIDIPAENRNRTFGIQCSSVESLKVRGAIDQKRQSLCFRHTPTVTAWLQTERWAEGRGMPAHVKLRQSPRFQLDRVETLSSMIIILIPSPSRKSPLDNPGVLLALASIETHIMEAWYEVQPRGAIIASLEILRRHQGLPLPRLLSLSCI